MQRSLSLLLIFFWGATRAQPNPYLADLSALKSILQTTHSYKTQIRGSQQTAYDSLYQRLAQDTVSNPLSFRYFTTLAQLFYALRDNHLGFQQIWIALSHPRSF